MSKKQSYILGSIVAIIVSGLCAWAGSVSELEQLSFWFGTASVVFGLGGMFGFIIAAVEM